MVPMPTTSLIPPATNLGTHINVADRLTKIATKMPDAIAIATPGGNDVAGNNSYTTCTFAELDRDAYGPCPRPC